jgi:Asp-tRNA(Asn)/Glu-tRNA(Gln) amidotransferase A subunit family amidase
VPFTSKNNLANTGFVITACNQAFIDLNATSTTDATVVARMKAAGAVLLGITGMPSLGLSSYCDDSACGVMNNPHDTRRTTGTNSC